MTVTDDNLVTVTLPSLGEDVEQATVSRWLVAPGDPIDVDTPLLEVATDKVDTEIPSPCAGVLLDILVGEDQAVSIGAALATIAVDVRASATESSSPGPTPAAPVEQTESAQPATPAPTPTPTPAEPAPDPAPAPVRIAVPATPSTPIAPQAVAPEPNSPPNGTTVQRLPRIRQTIARRMMDSLHNSAQLTTVLEADVTSIANLRNHHKARFAELTGTKLSFLPFFAKAAIEALQKHPVLAATVNTDCTEVTYYHSVNLGIAVDGPKGLMVPVIQRAEQLTIIDLATAINQLAEQVRGGTIGPDALVGGTFTITNTGSRGALFDTPILNQPQSGILGTGAVVERVVPQRDAQGTLAISVRSQVYLSVTYDHRVVDGADAARFLTTIKARLETGFSAEELFAITSPARADGTADHA
jgi:2-oxoglutarate dehydrogenase E2 component (dihydrolipoamide succinyltransferase)